MKKFSVSNHCERPGRIVAIWKGVTSRGLDKRCKMISSRLATKDEILLVHTNQFYENLENTKIENEKQLKNRGGTVRSIEYTNVILKSREFISK